MAGKTLCEKVWESHVVHEEPDGPALLYVDLHLVHEVTSAQAFEGLRLGGRTVRAIRVRIHAIGKVPDGWPSGGSTAWTYIDEIIVR